MPDRDDFTPELIACATAWIRLCTAWLRVIEAMIPEQPKCPR